MISRKYFLRNLTGSAAAVLLAQRCPGAPVTQGPSFNRLPSPDGTAEEVAADEKYWSSIQKCFNVDRNMIYLNSAGVNSSPIRVQQAVKKYLDYSYEAPSHILWDIMGPQKEEVRKRLAQYFGANAEEIAIIRNSSEGLQICQLGIELKKGDEVLTTNQDYFRMINTFKQRELREGVTMKQFAIPVPAENEEEIVRLFEENISRNTRLILMSHIVNKTGQILPVKKVVTMARKYNIPVIVDGAQSFGHIPFQQADLDCDYFVTSFHKWLSGPLGTGMLYVKKEKIRSLWPLTPSPVSLSDDIRKFEEIGTHAIGNFLAIDEALTFYDQVGAQRKQARLKYLSDYWISQVIDSSKVKLLTSRKKDFACGIATIQIEGIESDKLSAYLWEDQKIIAAPEKILSPELEGIRVSPNIFTTLEELDRLVSSLKKVMKSSL